MSMNPPGLRSAYQSAMGAQTGQPAPLPRTPEMENPTTQKDNTFFLDPSMLPQGHKCSVGDELTMKMKVKSIGSKIGLTPMEILPLNAGEDGSEQAGTAEAETY